MVATWSSSFAVRGHGLHDDLHPAGADLRRSTEQARGLPDSSEASARADLIAWLDVDDDDEPEVPREVGVVLASEDFSQEITTTVLWLNEFHGFDIRCIRLARTCWATAFSSTSST